MPARDNVDEMILMRRSGKTLQEISVVFGVSREWIRQITKAEPRLKNNLIADQAREMRQAGMRGSEIARQLGQKQPTVSIWVKGIIPADKSADRFWAKVDKSGECWEWTGLRYQTGYGRTCFHGKGNSYAHRVAYELTNGPIPAGMCVMHTCDNPPCTRPDHLKLGTVADNMADRDAKHRGYFERRPPIKGENHPRAKLTTDQVIQMRYFYNHGLARQVELSTIFGISCQTINNIVHRIGWSHV